MRLPEKQVAVHLFQSAVESMQQSGRPTSQSVFHRLQIMGGGSSGLLAGQERSPRFASTGARGGGGGGSRIRPLRLAFLAGEPSALTATSSKLSFLN